jgi:3-oxo-5-alpha-steroid 4-dehydrogenase 3
LSACRGKLTDKAPSRALGPLSDSFVPQAWFSHFYAIGCVSNLFILVNIALLIRDGEFSCPRCSDLELSMAFFAILFFQFHLCRRFVETIFVMKYPKDAKMHVLAYLFGLRWVALQFAGFVVS